MANTSGTQPTILYCPICKSDLRNVPRDEMVSAGYTRADGTVSPDTHTYECQECNNTFEINQNR